MQGSGYVYDTLLRPYISKHELDIDRSLIEFRERAWNLAIYYWHNCTELGSTTILQFLQFVASQGGRSTQSVIPEVVGLTCINNITFMCVDLKCIKYLLVAGWREFVREEQGRQTEVWAGTFHLLP